MNLGTRLAYCSLVLCCCLLPAEAQGGVRVAAVSGAGSSGCGVGQRFAGGLVSD
jgi:hypothetical protein